MNIIAVKYAGNTKREFSLASSMPPKLSALFGHGGVRKDPTGG
jgi:hypothetical protein